MRKNQRGFTVIELLIVFIVTAILFGLVVSNYASIQADSRNSNRVKELTAIKVQIDSYFNTHGYLPSLNDINSPVWREKNMKQLNANDLVDPLSKCDPNTSPCLVANPEKKAFAYHVTQSNGSSCEGPVSSDSNESCSNYTLTATYEGTFNGQKSYVLKNVGI